MANLYLFDIDGTLLDAMSLHLSAWKLAYKELFNISIPEETFTKKFGMPEKQIHKEICQELGLTTSIPEELMEHRASSMEKAIQTENIKILPGVCDFLNELRKRKEILGAITGNPEPTGKALLSKTGLMPYFQIHSYNNNLEQRVEIVKRAISQAREKQYKFDKVVVIGDTPSDFEAGREAGAYTVLVATGGHRTKQGLLNIGADLTLDSLIEYKKIFQGLSSYKS